MYNPFDYLADLLRTVLEILILILCIAVIVAAIYYVGSIDNDAHSSRYHSTAGILAPTLSDASYCARV